MTRETEIETAKNVRASLTDLVTILCGLAPFNYGELACMWFDDLYHPETDVHAMAFSPEERNALEKLNLVLGPAFDNLCSPNVTADEKAFVWDKVNAAASVAISSFREVQSS